MSRIRLHDLNDPRLAVYSSMTDSELRDPKQLVGLSRKTGDDAVMSGLFVAESALVIERALDAGHVPFAVFVDDGWVAQSAWLLDRVEHEFPNVPTFVCNKALMTELTGYRETRGPLAAFYRPKPPTLDELLTGARRVAVLENVGNYTNIGALFRSAAALGMDAVLITPCCHDPYYRRASRVSMGTVFQVPWTRIGMEEGSEANDCATSDGTATHWTDATLPVLHQHGFGTVALALTPNALAIDDPTLHGMNKLAVVLGAEGPGLDALTIQRCDHTAIIPMHHGVDSLNVAAASAVAFWELRAR